jgi:hypothetical protein
VELVRASDNHRPVRRRRLLCRQRHGWAPRSQWLLDRCGCIDRYDRIPATARTRF